MKYGTEIIPGHYGYAKRRIIWKDKSKTEEIGPGVHFFISCFSFTRLIKKVYGNKYYSYYSNDPYFLYQSGFLEMVITEVNSDFVKFKPRYSTTEFIRRNNGSYTRTQDVYKNTVLTEFKYVFADIAHKQPFGPYFPYDEEEYKTFYPVEGAKPIRFRIDPVIYYEIGNYLAYGKKYWNYGMSKKGLCYSSFKKNEDTQLLNDESELTIKFKDNKLTRNHRAWFCYDYEAKRDPHKRSWKENTKKRHQYEVNKEN